MNFDIMKRKYGPDFVGNVIRILDNRTLVVNTGKEKLTVGKIIQVYEPGEPLTNIDGTVLCSLDYIKDELEVIQVEEKYSICQKMKTFYKPITLSLSPLLGKSTEYVPLNVDENDIQELNPKDLMIRIGDPIKLAWQNKSIMVRCFHNRDGRRDKMTSENPSYHYGRRDFFYSWILSLMISHSKHILKWLKY